MWTTDSIRRAVLALAMGLGTAMGGTAVAAEDYSAGSEAKGWGLNGEVKARFEARAVDIVCALTGDCPADCGAGLRQMGLVRADDDALILVTKNGQAAFSGAAVDLAPYCNADIEVDGLMVGDPEITPGQKAQVYMVQRIRRVDGGEWAKANIFTKDWTKKNPDATGKGPWFRRDPRIKEQIAEWGYFGLGADVDAEYIEENF